MKKRNITVEMLTALFDKDQVFEIAFKSEAGRMKIRRLLGIHASRTNILVGTTLKRLFLTYEDIAENGRIIRIVATPTGRFSQEFFAKELIEALEYIEVES